MLVGVAACADDDDGIQEDRASEEMREEVMQEQFDDIAVYRTEITGEWMSDSLRAMLDLGNQRYTGRVGRYGEHRDVADARAVILEEGPDFVTFLIDDADTMTARTENDELILTPGSAGHTNADAGYRYRRATPVNPR